ncbi:MAG: BMP family protein [Bacillaceae bacterium]
MKKKTGLLLAMTLAATTILGACGSDKKEEGKGGSDTNFKVGMVTDAGTIDDKSFNQGTWEGILLAADELKLDKKKQIKYLKPAGTTEADYTKEINNLYDAGFKTIVTPGFKFETAIYKAQDKYKDANFVLIDGAPNNGKSGAEFESKVGDNTVAIYYAEQEAGFIAAVAAAVQVKEGEFGFIGGMKIPPVQKYNWGFQQGIKYANENLGTKITLKAENVKYEGTFDNVAGGQQMAATMYDRGVDVIFHAAGGVGVGVINEGKARAKAGKDVWVIGVDVDQFEDGKYDGDKSVILTSAVKKIDKSAADMIKAAKDGSFPGGQTLTFDAKNDGIGLPAENPNLKEEATKAANDVLAKIKSGEIKVAGEQGSLIE